MTRDTDISDETLTAYLDGELTRAEADMVADALVDSPQLAARLRALEVPIEDLVPAFDTMLGSMPPSLRNTSAPQPQQGIGPRMAALAATVLLATGLGLGAYLPKDTSPPLEGWHAYVAAYQALYVEETLSVVKQSAEMTKAQLAQVSTTLGRDLDGALDVPGLSYKRAQVLGFKGKPLVQLAYLSDTGMPFALCVLRNDETATLATMELEGLQAASWSDGSFAYLLIGGQDAGEIAQAASHLQAAL